MAFEKGCSEILKSYKPSKVIQSVHKKDTWVRVNVSSTVPLLAFDPDFQGCFYPYYKVGHKQVTNGVIAPISIGLYVITPVTNFDKAI